MREYENNKQNTLLFVNKSNEILFLSQLSLKVFLQVEETPLQH